jgi:hemerythrin-like domain-containing protein
MGLLDDLRSEHAAIERMAGRLRSFAAQGAGDAGDGAAFLRFFRLYTGRFHHAGEEDVLFPALAPAARVVERIGMEDALEWMGNG